MSHYVQVMMHCGNVIVSLAVKLNQQIWFLLRGHTWLHKTYLDVQVMMHCGNVSLIIIRLALSSEPS